MTDLMVNPPTREDCTEETVEHYLKQKEELQKGRIFVFFYDFYLFFFLD